MNETVISWTKVTWNPTFGCSRVSEGCRFCYAETIALKFGHSKQEWSARNAALNVVEKPHKLREPYRLKEAARIFVNSMSDLFHPEIDPEYRAKVFAVMADLPQHTFQVLTKRPELAAAWSGPWPENVWMGTSIEDARSLQRLDPLRECGAAVKFVSAEPLLAPLEGADFSGVDWLIVGGESGRHMPEHPRRWMQHSWARDLRDAAQRAGTAFFFKQSSGLRTELGTALEHEDGTFWLWQQFPDDRKAPVQVDPALPQYRVPQCPVPLMMAA